MGLDFLDIVFRTERAFALKLPSERFNDLFLKRHPPDITAGEWYEFARTLRLYGDNGKCATCGYLLKGLPPGHRCPECGNAGVEMNDADMWQMTCEILSDAIGCDRRKIQKDSLLRRDLGATM